MRDNVCSRFMVKKRPLTLLPHNVCLHYVETNGVLYVFTFDELYQYRLPVVWTAHSPDMTVWRMSCPSDGLSTNFEGVFPSVKSQEWADELELVRHAESSECWVGVGLKKHVVNLSGFVLWGLRARPHIGKRRRRSYWIVSNCRQIVWMMIPLFPLVFSE